MLAGVAWIEHTWLTMAEQTGIDWDALRRAAHEATRYAYVPYSKLSVGAAGVTADGQIVTGCNVENASFGLTLCAECGLISAMYRAGATGLVAVSIVNGDGDFLWPCGRCRQLLFEAGGPGLLVDATGGPVQLEALLPNAFGPEHLP